MRTIRSILAVALLAGVLALGAGASPASAQECAPNMAGLRPGPFLLSTTSPLPTLRMEAQLDLVWCAFGVPTHTYVGLNGRTVVFSAGGIEICRAVTAGNGIASCPLTSGNLLGVLLATASLQATASFAGDGLYPADSVQVPAIGPSIYFPIF